jgi:hypothetical protein
MTHLSPEELLDIAEGARPEHAHLASCAACRDEVIGMRALMSAVAAADMPEPSPLFWDHLSSRVSDAVAMEAPPLSTRGDRWGWVFNVWSWRLAAPIAAAAALAVAVFAVFNVSHGMPGSPLPPQQAAVAVAPEALGSNTLRAGEPAGEPADGDNASQFDSASDPSFAFVADLTTDMDMDTALDAGLVSDGSAEHAVTHLNEGELRELAKLLTEEIRRAQAS